MQIFAYIEIGQHIVDSFNFSNHSDSTSIPSPYIGICKWTSFLMPCLPQSQTGKNRDHNRFLRKHFPFAFHVVTLLRVQLGASYLAGLVCVISMKIALSMVRVLRLCLFDVSDHNCSAVLCLCNSVEKELSHFQLGNFSRTPMSFGQIEHGRVMMVPDTSGMRWKPTMSKLVVNQDYSFLSFLFFHF